MGPDFRSTSVRESVRGRASSAKHLGMDRFPGDVEITNIIMFPLVV